MSKDFWESGWPWPGAFGERLRNFPFAVGYLSKGRFFGPGEMRLAVLSLLNEGPKHGYQLMKDLGERSGGIYRASAGSIYPTLQQLEKEKLIRVKHEAGRNVYALVGAGRKELERDPGAVRRIWERAEECEDWGQSFGPQSMNILPMIAPLVKASLRAAGRGDVERVRAILDRALKDLETI